MIKIGAMLTAAAAAFAVLSGMAVQQGVKVEVKGLHLCCNACNNAATGAVTGAGGKEATASGGVVSFSAPNEKAAQKALDALAGAGFHGTVDSKTLSIKEDSGAVPPGKNPKPVVVSSATFKGIHNCCDGCNKPIKEAIKGVEGVMSDDAAPRAASFTVKGKFEPKKVVEALNAAGYHVKLEKVER
jgi:copper chaperone CopZ